MKIICIPYAGGGSIFFEPLKRSFKNVSVEVISVDYPGHGIRRGEKLINDLELLCKDISGEVNNLLLKDEKFILFGYSMGSLIAYEIIARKLLKHNPITLVVAAHDSPDTSMLAKKISVLSDEELVQELGDFGGVDERFRSNRRFWPVFLPIVRNDYLILENYNYERNENKLDVKILAFFSKGDKITGNICGWNNFSTNIRFVEVNGNHFFLRESLSIISSEIKGEMLKE